MQGLYDHARARIECRGRMDHDIDRVHQCANIRPSAQEMHATGQFRCSRLLHQALGVVRVVLGGPTHDERVGCGKVPHGFEQHLLSFPGKQLTETPDQRRVGGDPESGPDVVNTRCLPVLGRIDAIENDAHKLGLRSRSDECIGSCVRHREYAGRKGIERSHQDAFGQAVAPVCPRTYSYDVTLVPDHVLARDARGKPADNHGFLGVDIDDVIVVRQLRDAKCQGGQLMEGEYASYQRCLGTHRQQGSSGRHALDFETPRSR
ncbi:hypothetical protein C7456_11088 [Fulvimonas soli]|uniref:Uncharacterized protein n=1 Tax=Fulvimonas soli TaxID=155197 RepID=A0A316HXC1_9GAMM|nr:hypothetical protein C7456_11088 [Fulvimonas soli]